MLIYHLLSFYFWNHIMSNLSFEHKKLKDVSYFQTAKIQLRHLQAHLSASARMGCSLNSKRAQTLLWDHKDTLFEHGSVRSDSGSKPQPMRALAGA